MRAARADGRIITRFEDKGLQIVGAKLMKISQELAATHYEAHKASRSTPASCGS